MEEQNKEKNTDTGESEIYTIPSEFYGALPHRLAPRIVSDRPTMSASQTALSSARPNPDTPIPTLPSGAKSGIKSQKIIIIITAVFLLLAVGGFTVYYLRQAQIAKEKLQPTTSPAPVVIPPVPVVPTPTPVPPPPVEEPAPPIEASSTQVVNTPLIIFPFRNYALTPDADKDDLTDAEELLFGTDQQKPDTDSDGFVDGLEVQNLYNPLGYKPVRLIDSGRVKIYLNPTYGYSIYYPGSWLGQALDVNNQAVMFSSNTGEFIEASEADNPLKLSVADWYLAQSLGVQKSDLLLVITKEKVDGIISPDGLTAYLPFEDKIYIINYNIGMKTEINFLNTFKMMLNSFRIIGDLEGTNVETTISSTTVNVVTSTIPISNPPGNSSSTTSTLK